MAKKKAEFNGYYHIEDFLKTAEVMFEMSKGQVEGFKGYMKGKHYQTDEQEFLVNLKKYLNIK